MVMKAWIKRNADRQKSRLGRRELKNWMRNGKEARKSSSCHWTHGWNCRILKLLRIVQMGKELGREEKYG